MDSPPPLRSFRVSSLPSFPPDSASCSHSRPLSYLFRPMLLLRARGRLGGGARTWTMFRKLRDFICLCLSNLDCLVPLCNPQEGEGNAPVVVGALSDFLDPSTRSIFHQQKSTFLAESRFHPSIHDKLNGPSLCEAALDDDGGKRAKAARGNVKEGKEERADGQRRTEAEDLLQLEVKRSSIDSLGKKRKRRLLRANREGRKAGRGGRAPSETP